MFGKSMSQTTPSGDAVSCLLVRRMLKPFYLPYSCLCKGSTNHKSCQITNCIMWKSFHESWDKHRTAQLLMCINLSHKHVRKEKFRFVCKHLSRGLIFPFYISHNHILESTGSYNRQFRGHLYFVLMSRSNLFRAFAHICSAMHSNPKLIQIQTNVKFLFVWGNISLNMY